MNNKKNYKRIKMSSPSYGDDDNILKRFIIISLSIVVIAALVYLGTVLIQKDKTEEKTVTSGEINYSIASVGTILNRPYDEYYVMLYSSKDGDSPLYGTILSNYASNSSNDDYIKIYYCDLNNSINSNYYNEKDNGNNKATSVSEFEFGKFTLLKIKNGKIIKYLEGYDEIKAELK